MPKRYEIRETFILGGKGSGNRGHKGYPGIGGSSAKGFVGVYDSGKRGKANVYEYGPKDNLPNSILQKKGVRAIVVELDGGLIVGDQLDVSKGSTIFHGELTDMLDRTPQEFDRSTRVNDVNGVLEFSSYSSIDASHISKMGAELDRAAERNIQRASRRLIAAGYSPDSPAIWEIADQSKLKLTLGGLAGHRKNMLEYALLASGNIYLEYCGKASWPEKSSIRIFT